MDQANWGEAVGISYKGFVEHVYGVPFAELQGGRRWLPSDTSNAVRVADRITTAAGRKKVRRQEVFIDAGMDTLHLAEEAAAREITEDLEGQPLPALSADRLVGCVPGGTPARRRRGRRVVLGSITSVVWTACIEAVVRWGSEDRHRSASRLTPVSGCEMPIRDNYVPTLNAIAGHYGEAPPTAQIGPRATLQATIGYTRRHVVQHTTPHFRYQYYHNALSLALRRLHFDSADRQVVHLDIGCGPGVFSWVVYDYMESQETRDAGQVFYYGYDHSAAMIQLAHLFLDRFPVRYEFHGYSDLAEIVAALANREFSNCDVVVTFGYALVQVRKNPVALGEFATLISCVVPSLTLLHRGSG